MPEVKYCPKCKGIMYHNIGESHKINPKTGKEYGPYENWKCGSCNNIEWVGRKRPSPMAGIQKEADQGEEINNALKLLNDNMISGFEVINNNIKALIQKLDK